MQLSPVRFAGDIRVSTIADHRTQSERLHAILDLPKDGSMPKYLDNQQPVLETLRAVSCTEIKKIVERLNKFYQDNGMKLLNLIPGHNHRTATIDYGVNPRARVDLHEELAALGADYIDTDGEALPASTKLQLRDQYLEQFGQPIEREILKLMKKSGLTLGVVESATGGLTSSRLTDIKGSSYCIAHNIVTYANEAKTRAVGVDADFLAKEGPYNERTARDMATGIIKATESKVGLSFTGLAGCNKWGEEFSGVCFIGLAGLTPEPIVKRVQVDADLPREIKKRLFSEYGLIYLKQYLEGTLQA